MQIGRRCLISVLILATLSSTNHLSAGESNLALSNDDAKSIIEQIWDGYFVAWPIGDLKVVREGFSGLRTVQEKAMPTYKTLQSLGLLNITHYPVQLLETTLEGIVQHIRVPLTPEGAALNKMHAPSDAPLFGVKEGDFKIQKVVRNEPVKVGIKNYQLVMVTYTFQYDPTLQRVFEAQKKLVSSEFKARLLLEFDPFSDKWTIAAQDRAKLNEEFKTNEVTRALHSGQ